MPDEIQQNIAALLNHDNYGKVSHNYLLNKHVFTRNNINIKIQKINLSCLTNNFAGTKRFTVCAQYYFITVKFAMPIGRVKIPHVFQN